MVDLRSMNVCVWRCAATVFAMYREFVAPSLDNLSIEFWYKVSKEKAELFISNEKSKSKLLMSKEPDIKEGSTETGSSNLGFILARI